MNQGIQDRLDELREGITYLKNKPELSGMEKIYLLFFEEEVQEKENLLDSQRWRHGLSDAARLKVWELQNEIESLKSAG